MGILAARIRPKQSLLAFCDEASHNQQRYCILGAVYFVLSEGADSIVEVGSAERQLTELKRQYGLLERIKWTNVPTQPGNYFNGYSAFLRDFLESDGLYFKCMVIDTHKHPLNNVALWGGDVLVGYQKFYCVFLADGLMKRFPNLYYDVVIDQFSGVDCADLERAIEGRYVKKAKPKSALYHCKVRAGDEKQSNILQLADLLVGAVGFAWNGGMLRNSRRAAQRIELVNLLQSRLKIKLSKPTS